jgi:proteasome activator subunit 4
MSSPLDKLLTAAASDPDGIVQPTYDFGVNLYYSTRGEADREAGLRTLLLRLYISIMGENYKNAMRWSGVLLNWITREYSVPRKLRAALVRIYYDLALTPGMDGRPAQVFANMIPHLVRYV